MFLYYKSGNELTENEKLQIWDILCECDADFFPKLSARESSSQKQLRFTENTENDVKPISYYNEMIKQEFILAKSDEQIKGFMTFKPDYICDATQTFGTSLYITTVCVRKADRRHGIMNKLYDYMEAEMPVIFSCPLISTRTWSLNTAQTNTLPGRGYDILATLENDRGEGIHTIYFGKTC